MCLGQLKGKACIICELAVKAIKILLELSTKHKYVPVLASRRADISHKLHKGLS